jgi:hypothetical protein
MSKVINAKTLRNEPARIVERVGKGLTAADHDQVLYGKSGR